MTWVRYDDNVANHPKVAPLDDATYRLWREAIEWCAHNLTDGVIRAHQLTVTSTRASKARAGRLVQHGLWHLAGTACGSGKCPPSGSDGWVVHDYWDYQPTRQKVREEQAAKAERQRKWLQGRKKKQDGGRDASGDASQDTSGDGVRDGVRDGAPAPPRPAPEGRAGALLPPASAVRRQAADAAAGGREEDQNPGGHSPPGNGRPSPPPGDVLDQLRGKLRATSAKQRATANQRERRGLDDLRAATPTIPIPTHPEEPS